MLCVFRRLRSRADLLMQPVLHLVLHERVVLSGMKFGPQVLGVVPVATNFKRYEMIFFVVGKVSVFVPVCLDLPTLQPCRVGILSASSSERSVPEKK
jgi:hypothetical protein